MAVKIPQAALGSVNCPMSTNVKAEDGFGHEMVRLFPLLVLSNGEKATLQDYAKAVAKYAADVAAIAEGQEVIVVLDDGREVALKPNDGIPSLSEQTTRKRLEKDANGVEQMVEDTTVFHGQNMPISLPVSAADYASAFNVGVKNAVMRDGVTAITNEFRAEGGKRGRKGVTFDPTKIG